jgi:DNA-binding transcriptional regulator GbsR (MarR family)
MVSDFRVSGKTKRPPCCDFSCCGNKFGRIEKSFLSKGKKLYPKHHQNRIVKTRRYAKHVERQLIKKEIENQLIEELESMLEDIKEWNEFWEDCE